MRNFAYFILIPALIIVFRASVQAAGYIEWLFPGAYNVQPYTFNESSIMEFGAGYSDLLREHLKLNMQNNFQSDYISFGCNLPVKFTHIEDCWGVSLKKSNLDYNYSTTPAQQSAFNSDLWRAELSYSVQSKIFNSALSLGGGTCNNDRLLWNLKAKTNPLEFIELTYSHYSDIEQIKLQYDYEGERIDFPVGLSTSSDSYTLKLSPWKKVYWENLWRISWLNDYYPADEPLQADPSVKYQRIRSMLYVPLSKAIILGAGWSEYTFTGEARLLDQAVSFGKITTIEADFKGPMMRLELKIPEDRNIDLEFEYVEADAKTRGHLEFWPFTPTLVDLIGYRRYFNGWINADGYRYSCSTDFKLFGKICFNPVINLVDLFTDAELSTWQPEWLVFGVTDENVSHLKVRRLQAALINLNLSLPSKWGTISYAFTQWIPLRVFERSSSQLQGDTSGPGYPEMKPESSTGGRVHQLSISVDLNKILKR